MTLSVPAVAKRAGVSVSLVRRWIHQGLLPAKKLPGAKKEPVWRIETEAWEQFWRSSNYVPKKM